MTNRLSRPDLRIHSEETIGGWAVQEPSVVHSSFGRLRVHLPHWNGEHGDALVAAIRQFQAVKHAEANPLTGNVLILFESPQTSEPTLIQSLSILRLEPSSVAPSSVAPAPIPAVESSLTLVEADPHPAQGETVYMTGVGRVIYKALGWTSVGLAVIGAITPGIPTAPFVILAGYFFIRSSPEAHEWLRRSRWFGGILRDWEAHHGVRRSIRNVAVALIGGSMILTLLMGLPAALTITIVACQVIGLAFVLRLKVVEPVALEPA